MNSATKNSSSLDQLDVDPNSGLAASARFLASPNFDDRPDNASIDALIIHAISLPPNCYGDRYVEQLFTNQLNANDHPYFVGICELRVSAHFFIDRCGNLTQFVPTTKRAWHAGVSSFDGRNQVNDFSIGIELEGCDDDLFEATQYHCLSKLSRGLMAIYPGLTKDSIVGHSDIAPGRKTDPGPHFDWQRYLSSLPAYPTDH